MASGWYAAVIRLRIKQRLHIRVGTNRTLRIQGRILLLPPLLSTPDEARGRAALCIILTQEVMQPVNKMYMDWTFQLQKQSPLTEAHPVAYWPTLGSAQTCDCNYACMNACTGACSEWAVSGELGSTMGDGGVCGGMGLQTGGELVGGWC